MMNIVSNTSLQQNIREKEDTVLENNKIVGETKLKAILDMKTKVRKASVIIVDNLVIVRRIIRKNCVFYHSKHK